MKIQNKPALILLVLGVACLLFGAGSYFKTWQEGKAAEEKSQRLLAYYMQMQTIQMQQTLMDTIKQTGEDASRKEAKSPSYDLSVTDKYPIMGILTMDTIGTVVPVIDRFSDELLTVSVCRYQGPANPAEDGNIVISGHNYRSGAHFGRLKQLQIGDVVQLTDLAQNKFSYQVAEMETVAETQIDAIENQLGTRALTLFTCNEKGDKRLIVRCKAIEE